jgi:hypothetical protein
MRPKTAVSTLLALAGVAFVLPAGPARAASPAAADDWAQLQTILSGIQGRASAPIANVTTPKYTAGMLLGNGDLGVVAGGDKNTNQRFYFGKGDFWGTAWDERNQDMRIAILSLGNLTVSSPTASTNPAPAYGMTQDLLNAEVRSTVKLGGATVAMRSWTADSDNAFVTELSSPAGSPAVPINIDLALPGPDSHTTYPTTVGGAGGTIWATRHNNLTGTADPQAAAAIAVRPVGVGFSSTSTSGSHASGRFTLAGGATVALATVFRSDARAGRGGPTPAALAAQATTRVNGLTDATVAALRADHRAWWKNFWLKSIVQLGDPTMMAYWYGGLYVMGAASRPGKIAPGMYGQWVTSDATKWPRYWMNYNVEAPFYGVASANHPELIQPYNVQQASELPWQVNWTAAAGYRGAMWERTTSPLRQYLPTPAPKPVAPTKNPRWTDQKSNGGFAVMPSLMYYDDTQDDAYLRSTLYPNLRALDEFFRDYLTWDGKRFVMARSSAHEDADDLNPNLDLGFIRRIESFLIGASARLGVDAELVPVWQNVLDHLSAYPTGSSNGKTVYLEAENPPTFHRGDQPINMEGSVFPGENLSVGGDPAQLKIAIDTLQEMNSWGVTAGGNSNNGFPKEFPIAARVGWPAADLVSKLDAAIRHQWRASNLTVAQGGGGIETSGTIEAVDSMLMQSVSGTIRLFADACWPAAKDASFKRLRAVGAFTVSATLTGGVVGPVTLTSEAGRPVRLKNPWKTGTVRVESIDGTAVPFTETGGVIAFATSTGTSYRIASLPQR